MLSTIEANEKFLKEVAALLGRKLTVAECYIAFGLRDNKFKDMKNVPKSIKLEGI